LLLLVKPGVFEASAIVLAVGHQGQSFDLAIMDLTAHGVAGAEIEITDAMIEAGADVLLCEFGDGATIFWSAPDLAMRVYQAMRAAATDRD
jgi:hypothetical protein